MQAQLTLHESIKRLATLGLIEETESGAILLHPLIAYFVKDTASELVAEFRSRVEASVLDAAKQDNMTGDPRSLLSWQPHLRHVTDQAFSRTDIITANLCNELALHLAMIGDMNAARTYYERVLAIRLELLGEHHPDTAHSLNNLGVLLNNMGDYPAARSYLEQALTIYETILGEKHQDTATSLNNLGELLQATGNYTDARPYYERALVIRQQVLGKDHPDTATSLNSLGALLYAIGDYMGAGTYYERALAIRESVLGVDHPDTAQSLNNLGLSLQAVHDYANALPYLERALAIRQSVLGTDHPDTAQSLNNLGLLLQAMGDLAGARVYYERTLAIRRTVLGEQHPDIARSLNNLGFLLQAMGDYADARPYLERALTIRESVLGADHPDTAQSLNNLGLLLQALGDHTAARRCYERALAIYKQVLGEQHPATAQSLNNLGLLLIDTKEYEAARIAFEQALPLTRLFEDHLGQSKVLASLGTIYTKTGDYQKATEYFTQSLTLAQQLGDRHNEGYLLSHLAGIYQSQGQIQKAITYYEQVLNLVHELNDQPLIITTLQNLATTYQRLNQIEQALSYFEQYAALIQQTDRQQAAETLLTMGQLAQENDLPIRARQYLTASRAIYAELKLPYVQSIDALLADLSRIQQHRSLAEIAFTYLQKAGFSLEPAGEPTLFIARPVHIQWINSVKTAIVVKIIPTAILERQAVLDLVSEAHDLLNDKPHCIFVICEHNPTNPSWLQIATLRAEGIQIMPILASVLAAGEQKGRHRDELFDYLENRFLSPQLDLYDISTPISDQLNFFGREKLVDQLLTDLERGVHIALFGLRKMGKTSLLNRMRDQLSYPVALVDLQLGTELFRVYERILNDWARWMGSRLPASTWIPPTLTNKKHVSEVFSNAANQLLNELDRQSSTTRLAIFVDEIELIWPAQKSKLNCYLAFARTLRGLSQERLGRISLIVAGVDPKIVRMNRLYGEQNPFYNFFRAEYLSPLNSEDCKQMISNIGAQMDIQFEDTALDFVAQISGGHPYWARKLCSLAFQNREGSGTITRTHLEAMAKLFVQDPDTATLLNKDGLWGEVTNPHLWLADEVKANKSILVNLAKTERRTRHALVTKMLPYSAYNTSLYELRQRSILAQPENDAYWIRLRLFRDWLRSEIGEG